MGRLLLTISLLFIFRTALADGPPAHAPLLIKEITIIDGTGKDPFVASVLIEGNKISKIIKGSLVPASNATIIDGRGKYLIPGLIDLQTHVTLQSHVAGTLKDFDSGELDSLYRSTQEKDAQKRLSNYKAVLRFSLKSGVTTFVDSNDSINDVTLIRGAINDVDYPNFYSLGPILSYSGGHPYPLDSTVDHKNPNASWKYPLPEITENTSQADSDAAQSILKTDLTKLIRDGGLSGLNIVIDAPAENGKTSPRVPFETIKTVCDVAQTFQKPVFFTAISNDGIQDAVRAGAKIKLGPPLLIDSKGNSTTASDETLKILSQNKISVLSLESSSGGALGSYVKNPLSVQAEVFTNPTISKDTADNYKKLISHYKDQNDSDPDHKAFVKKIDGQISFEKIIHNLLVKSHSKYQLSIIPTGDEGSLWTFHGTLTSELNLMTGHGAQSLNPVLTPQEVIKAATLDAATVMNLQDSIGSIEEGKLADVLILSKNPLDDIANVKKIDQVIKSGAVVNFLTSPN